MVKEHWVLGGEYLALSASQRVEGIERDEHRKPSARAQYLDCLFFGLDDERFAHGFHVG